METFDHGCELRSHPLVLTPGRESVVTEETHSSQCTEQEDENGCEASSKPRTVEERKPGVVSWDGQDDRRERRCRSDEGEEETTRKKFELVDQPEKLKEWRQLKFGKRAGGEEGKRRERIYRCERIRSIAKERAKAMDGVVQGEKGAEDEHSEKTNKETTFNKHLPVPRETSQLLQATGVNTNQVESEKPASLREENPRVPAEELRPSGRKACASGRDAEGDPLQGFTIQQLEAERSLRKLQEEAKALSEREEELNEKERSLEFVEQELLEADLRLQEQAKEQRDNKDKLDSLQLQLEEEGRALGAQRKEVEEKHRKLVIFEQELILREKQLVEKETKMAATDENLTRWIEEMSEVASQDTPRRLGRSPLAPDSRRVPMTERKVADQERNGSERNWPLSERKPTTLKSLERPLDRIKRDISLQF